MKMSWLPLRTKTSDAKGISWSKAEVRVRNSFVSLQAHREVLSHRSPWTGDVFTSLCFVKDCSECNAGIREKLALLDRSWDYLQGHSSVKPNLLRFPSAKG